MLPLICVSDVSAALGLSLETMSKEELDGMKDVMHLILQGVSCNPCLLIIVGYLDNSDGNTTYVRLGLLPTFNH